MSTTPQESNQRAIFTRCCRSRTAWFFEASWLPTTLSIKAVYLSLEVGALTKRSIVGTVLFASLFVSASAYLPTTARRIFSLAVSLSLSALFLTDLAHFRFFGQLTCFSELFHASQVIDFASGVLPLLRPADLILALDIPFFFLLLWNCGRLRLATQFLQTRGWLLSLVILLNVTYVGAFYVREWRHPLPSTFSSDLLANAKERWKQENTKTSLLSLGVTYYHLVDFLDYLLVRTKPEGPALESLARDLSSWNRQRSATFDETSARVSRGSARGRNLIVLQVEGLHAFTLFQTIDGHSITPNLSRLARRGVHFDNFFAQTLLGATSDADFIANTSLLPSRRTFTSGQFSGNTFLALPHILARSGYHSVAAHSGPPTVWNYPAIHRALGFNAQWDIRDLPPSNEKLVLYPDHEFLQHLGSRLPTLPRPFFISITTLSSHLPFTHIPSSATRLPLPSISDGRLREYLNAIHYVDYAIGQFFDTLEKQGLLQNSLIVLYGDHGVLPFPVWRHLSDRPEQDRLLDCRVPMVILAEGVVSRAVISEPAGQIDIAPTLEYVLCPERQWNFFLGENLFAAPQSRLVVWQDGRGFDGNRLARPNRRAFELEYVELGQGGGDRRKQTIRFDERADHLRWISDCVLEYDLFRLLSKY